MKKILQLVSVLVCFLFSQQLFAQSAEENQAWMNYMTPGEMHKMLANSNGDWKAKITFWMDENAPSQSYEATCTNTMILGGRYQQSSFKGEMMGMPFEGIGITAYDNARKVFMMNWIDNMGTGMLYGEGKYNNGKKQIEFKGLSTDPATGDILDYREVFTFVSEKKETLEMYITVKGKELKTMEIVLTR